MSDHTFHEDVITQNDGRVEYLLERYFDRLLTAEERCELSTILLASERARHTFWQHFHWDMMLRKCDVETREKCRRR